jgi:DNA-binding transcriptional LysR family regulator
MNNKQLTYFITIVEEGTILKAAEKLHIAQPPLSQQLKLLEEELDCTLIERTTRKSHLTEAGQKLYDRAKQILKLMDITVKEVNDINNGLCGKLSIGTVSSAGASFLPEMLNDYHKKYPKINFEIIDEDTYKIIELLDKGIINIGIIRTLFNLDMFESIILPNVPMVAIGKNLEFINRCDNIEISDLINMALIIQQRYEKTIIELCFKSGFTPNILCRSNDIRTILLWATNGIGTAIVPKDCLHLIPSSDVKYVEINEPSFNVGTAIIWSKNHYLTSAARNFLNLFSILRQISPK